LPEVLCSLDSEPELFSDMFLLSPSVPVDMFTAHRQRYRFGVPQRLAAMYLQAYRTVIQDDNECLATV
jgi:hypothetical protein